MPATMMHLYAAHMLWEEGGDAFYLGNIIPDCVDADRPTKDRMHFRDGDPAQRRERETRFFKTLDLEQELNFGFVFHYFLDHLWDIGPQAEHRRAYRGTDWFPAYRDEIRHTGSYLAHSEPWAKPLWRRLFEAPLSLCENSIGLPMADIRSFMAHNAQWHKTECLPPSDVFTPELVQAFTRDACRQFREYLKTDLPVPLPKGFS